MHSEPFHCSMASLGNTKGTPQHNKILPAESFRYTPVGCGGWGIVRVGLLVPESGLLFVGPSGCGRHGAIAGIQAGFKRNLAFLHVTETDIVTGAHMDKAFQAVSEILQTASPGYKAYLICATCLDTLLASDYDGLALALETDHGIPVRACHMNPINMDGNTPPPLAVQETVYDFLNPTEISDNALNVIGGFAPPMSDSEFFSVLANAGYEAVRHIAAADTFGQFQQMSRSAANILIRPEGKLAAKAMRRKLNIPYFSMPHSFGTETINNQYAELGEFLGKRLKVAHFHEQALDMAQTFRRKMGRLRIAVGQSLNADPFELARALINYGFEVPYIFTDIIAEPGRPHAAWLCDHASESIVYTNSHTSMVDFLKAGVTVDLALGFDAGYYCSATHTVPLSLDEQPFGFNTIAYLFEEIEKAMQEERPLKEQIYGAGLVI